jgi:hypothetical protein
MQPVEEMNAAKHEIEDAQREGVKIRGNLLPVKVLLDERSGRAKALRVVEVEWVKGKPVEKPGTEMDLEADLIVSAIGQTGDLSGMEELDNGKGLIAADKFYQLPNRQGVFACGDIIRPHLLTTVIGQGSIAADSIDRYLGKKDMAKRPKVDVHHFNLLDKLRNRPVAQNSSRRAEAYPIDQGLRGTSSRARRLVVCRAQLRGRAEESALCELFSPLPVRRPHQAPESTERHRGSGSFRRTYDRPRRSRPLLKPSAASCGILCVRQLRDLLPADCRQRTPKAESTMGRYVYTDYDLYRLHICGRLPDRLHQDGQATINRRKVQRKAR